MNSILIIGSDEYSILLKEELRKLKYKIYCSSKPKQGIDKSRQKHPDLLIINATSEGSFIIFDIIKEIKSDVILKNTSIIILSDNDDDMDKTISIELGADDYIVKPINLSEILIKIKCFLKYKPNIPTRRRVKKLKIIP